MGFTKPIEQFLFSYQGAFNVSKRYYTRRMVHEEDEIVQRAGRDAAEAAIWWEGTRAETVGKGQKKADIRIN